MSKNKAATQEELIIAALNDGSLKVSEVATLKTSEIIDKLDKPKLRQDIDQRKMLMGVGAGFIVEIQKSIAMKTVVKNSPELKAIMEHYNLDVKSLIKAK